DFKSITITELVKKADFNRGTFYAHYRTKEDLLEEMIGEKLSQLKVALQEPYKNNQKISLQENAPSILPLFEHVFQNADFYKLLLDYHIMPGFQEQFCEVIRDHQTKILTEYKSKNHNIKREIVVYYSSYSILGMVLYWIRDGLSHSPRFMTEQIRQILLNRPDNIQIKTSLD
ncbi:TetR/AcrR family transcriptional regulator, partial [Neobacillus niacini]|uniref:TetR/AcrR family transcriptional regulator n=1 Tax=Neobacillus niacini TaxID=86668 RepID=UPI0030010276